MSKGFGVSLKEQTPGCLVVSRMHYNGYLGSGLVRLLASLKAAHAGAEEVPVRRRISVSPVGVPGQCCSKGAWPALRMTERRTNATIMASSA